MGLLLRGIVWAGAWLVLALAPLAVALLADPLDAGRPFATELGVACGFVAFALIALELALVSRLRAASEPFGTDVLMLLHRQLGLLALGFLVAHVALLARGGAGLALLDPLSALPLARYGAWAFLAVLAIVATSLLRRRLRLVYEAWQAVHVLGAALAVSAMLAHALAAGAYTSAPAVRAVLVLFAALFLALLLRYRLVRPLLLLRRPWEVAANRDEGADTRTLVLRPVGHAGLAFEPGQFVWLCTGRSPLLAGQHPLTISSSAEQDAERTLELSIKALGDWSRRDVPALAPGRRVWVDGPYGAFTPDRTPAQGFVLIAGGIGVTPMRSILLTLRDRGDRRPVWLFYAADRRARTVFGAELARLERELDLRLVHVFEHPEPDWQGERGYVTGAVLRRHLPPRLDHLQFFVCGPAPMMAALERDLRELGVRPGRIQTERFDMV
jgi:predicted ferric reductase